VRELISPALPKALCGLVLGAWFSQCSRAGTKGTATEKTKLPMELTIWTQNTDSGLVGIFMCSKTKASLDTSLYPTNPGYHARQTAQIAAHFRVIAMQQREIAAHMSRL
jgi:hypothetical protein